MGKNVHIPDYALGSDERFKRLICGGLRRPELLGGLVQKWHFALRKPLFYPLNYGNNDLERINGLNGDGQDTLAMRASFALDAQQAA